MVPHETTTYSNKSGLTKITNNIRIIPITVYYCLNLPTTITLYATPKPKIELHPVRSADLP